MKVLFIILSLTIGGAEKSLVNLLNELPADRYEVDLMLFRREGEFLNQVPSWVNLVDPPEAVTRFYGPVSGMGKYLPVKSVGTLIARIKEKSQAGSEGYRWEHCYRKHIPCFGKEYDTAIAYASGEPLYFVRDKVRAKRKLVWFHSDYAAAGFSKEYDASYLADCSGIVSISDQCVQILRETFPELKDRIYNIANITSSAVIEKRAGEFSPFSPSGFKADRPNLLCVGRLETVKGFSRAVRAASVLKQRGLSFHWFIVGGGTLQDELEHQITEEDVSDCFTLLGMQENPYPYMKHCMCMVQTSIYEGKSVVLDEAKIFARPIIATNYPTVHDQVAEGLEGLIVEPDPEAIADGIERLLRDDTLRSSITEYLGSHKYGNQEEISKYMALIEGEPMPEE